MYDVALTLFITAFFVLVGMRLYHVRLAKVAKKRAKRLVRIRSIVAWLRQNIHLPKRLLQRKERQVARTERWAREKAEELARVARAKYVEQTLDVLPLLVAAHYAPMRRAVRPN